MSPESKDRIAMYAIIKHGSRQFRVEKGQEIEIDYREAGSGDAVTFDKVLAAGTGADLKFGTPLLSGATVSAEVIGTVQGPKLVVQKFRRRKNSRRKTGHRQIYTKVRITDIAV
jgi:large subunit ribosomal protein L21